MTLLEKEKEPPLVRLRRGLGSPWTGLGIYGVGTLIKGLFYLPMLGNPSRLPAVEQWGGPNLWAFVWIIVGAFAICAVLTRRCGAIAAGGLFFIYLIWGGMYLIAEVYGNYPLGSMASVVYLLVAATIFWAFSRPPRWSRSSSNQRTARVREIPNERKPSRGRRRSGGPRRCRADRIYHRPIR